MFERGDVVVCVMSGDYGKPRPAVVVQSDLFNATHDSVTLCPITSHYVEAPLFRILVAPNKANGLKERSQIMIDKVMTLRRNKIHQKIGVLTVDQQAQLDQALLLWLGLEM